MISGLKMVKKDLLIKNNWPIPSLQGIEEAKEGKR